MIKSTLIASITVAALAAGPSVANAASDTARISEVGAQFMTALDGAIVKITGAGPNHTLTLRKPDGTVGPVPGAPARPYRSVDLGHDASGNLVLTYIRCDDGTHCNAYSDDLHGNRASFQALTPARCDLTSAPARWGNRTAYGLLCDKLTGPPNHYDASRSGLFVRTGSGTPKRLLAPSGTARWVNRVDLRGTIVGAVAPDNESRAFTQTVDATQLHSMKITDNQGESDDWWTMSMALGSGGRLWTLVVDSEEFGDDVRQLISRLGPGTCDVESIAVPVDPNTHQAAFPLGAMAVDANTLYVDTSGGISTRAFTPAAACL
jgi:hypothetical protein